MTQIKGAATPRGTPLLLCGLLASSAYPSNAALSLTGKKGTSYRIIIASNAPPAEHYGAEELQHYFKKVTGANFPILTDAEEAVSKEILLGQSAHLRKLNPKIDCGRLGPDGYVLRTDHNSLIIAGGKPRGTLNGV